MSEIKPNSSNAGKLQKLYLVLCAIFLTNAILAEMIGVKIFSLEALLHSRPAQIPLLKDFVLDFNLTAGVLVWPIVFITSDIINEYFGKPGVKRISYLTAILITYVFGAVFVATILPPADFWMEVNKTDVAGHSFNINSAFATIFRQGLGIILGSITAFLIGQILDAHAFHWIKTLTGSNHLWLRATGSTLISQLIDSFVVLVVAFYVFGNWSFSQVIAVGIINYIYKFSMAVFLTPLLYVVHYVIDGYLGLRKIKGEI
ncbi:MAG TPA: queuosine precursor transporter [Catalimonadaceae bacterium]|nr:queuosine precursor transporter [Catalimonadaceae bacterium]